MTGQIHPANQSLFLYRWHQTDRWPPLTHYFHHDTGPAPATHRLGIPDLIFPPCWPFVPHGFACCPPPQYRYFEQCHHKQMPWPLEQHAKRSRCHGCPHLSHENGPPEYFWPHYSLRHLGKQNDPPPWKTAG